MNPRSFTAAALLSATLAFAGPPAAAKNPPAPKTAAVPSASAKKFNFNDPHNRDTTSVLLDAPLETINGLTNHLTGSVSVDATGQLISGEFKVPVNTIRTGNSSRDGDLQNDKWLAAAKHPNIVATFKDVKVPAKLEPGKPQTFDAQASFTIKGQTHEEPVKVTALYLPESDETKNRGVGDFLRVKAKFSIALEKYGITRGPGLLLKVAETADVSVDAWGSTKL